VNLSLRVQTRAALPVQNIREEKKNCNCNLSSSFNITGEVLVNGTWHRTSWNSSGQNISKISAWDLVNY